MPKSILGISAYYHDSAAALLVNGRPVAAAQEERFTRIKNDPAFPAHAVQYCLESAGLQPIDLDAVVFYDKPLLKFERLLSTSLAMAPCGFDFFRHAFPAWIREKLWIPGKLRKAVPGVSEYLFSSHHLSHAAAAFYPSPFERAAVLTVDGVGEWGTCSYGVGNGKVLLLDNELRFPHSLGLLYSAFTAYLGFRVNEGEYKVMGLAPYGEPRFVEHILNRLIIPQQDGSFALDMRYFGYLSRLSMTNPRFHKLFEGEPRTPESPLEQRHLDIAASIQVATEELMLGLARRVALETGEKKLCLAGGVALNCVANGRLQREGPFDEIWIQPAAGDAGAALGAAYVAYFALNGELPDSCGSDLMGGGLLGPEYCGAQIESVLRDAALPYEQLGRAELLDRTVSALAAGEIGGWFQGRMEFGPRALGNRSILADPRRPDMQQRLNMKIKFREGFRPFAPAVLAERCQDYFDLRGDSPYMLKVCSVAASCQVPVADEGRGLGRLGLVRSTLPAVTHVDQSARVQTVDGKTNPLFYSLLKAFESLTGCPLLVNTSFNVKDEPIVCTPGDAVNCFLKTDIDFLVIGDYWVKKDSI